MSCAVKEFIEYAWLLYAEGKFRESRAFLDMALDADKTKQRVEQASRAVQNWLDSKGC